VKSGLSSIALSLILLLYTIPPVWSQEVSISLSSQIDTLSAQLLRNPDDRALQLRLIDAYTLSFNPELALLELLNAEARGKLMREGAGIKGTVQLSLEQTSAAFSSLTQAYLAAPSDEILLLIAIVEYARGETQRGFWEMSRLKPRIPDLSVKLLGLYERFYLNGRKTIARAILRALQEVDPVAYGTYFPVPQISILSPSDNYATEAAQVSVALEVRHSRPIQMIRVGGLVVYDRGEWKGGSANETFSQSYTTLLSIQEGRNPIVIQASDIFGNETSDTVLVNGMNFNRLASWNSPLVDSLRKGLQYLQNYIPDSILTGEQRNVARALIIAGTASADSTDLFNRGMFLHEFLTNPVSGIIPPANAKLLLKHRVEELTMKMVLDDWLLKGATFQSVTVVYCAGNWKITEDHWLLQDRRGGAVDVKPYVQQLSSLATAGVVIIVDGTIDNRAPLEGELRRLVGSATIPFEVVVLPDGAAWPWQWSVATLNPDSVKGTVESDGSLDARDFPEYFRGALALSGELPAIPIARNPASVIVAVTERMLSSLSQKLTKEKIDDSAKGKILTFSSDWRRYNEISRYLSNQFSISDFIIRVEEYLRRGGGGEK